MEKREKILKAVTIALISIISIFLIIFLLVLVDYNIFYNKTIKNSPDKNIKLKQKFTLYTNYYKEKKYISEDKTMYNDNGLKKIIIEGKGTVPYRPVENPNSPNESIIIFGDDKYTYEQELKNNQTLSYYLGKNLNRPIINRSLPTFGLQEMLYQLKSKDFYEHVKKPKYVIYFFTYEQQEHVNNPDYIRYQKKGNLMKLIKPTDQRDLMIENIFVYEKIKPLFHFINNKVLEKVFLFIPVNKNLVLDSLIDAKKEIANNFGQDVQFIVIDTDTRGRGHYLKKLQKNGITILETENIKSFKNLRSKYFKNNPKLIEDFTKEIIKELKLY